MDGKPFPPVFVATLEADQNMFTDRFGRQMRDLRISITDRCNFRCVYCMPFEVYGHLPGRDILTYEEIARLAGIMVGEGVRKITITGGEPLSRRGVPTLVNALHSISYATLQSGKTGKNDKRFPVFGLHHGR